MEGLLSVMQSEFGVLRGDGGKEGGSEFEFYASGDLIVEFDFCVEGVDGGPALSQGDTAVGVFSF